MKSGKDHQFEAPVLERGEGAWDSERVDPHFRQDRRQIESGKSEDRMKERERVESTERVTFLTKDRTGVTPAEARGVIGSRGSLKIFDTERAIRGGRRMGGGTGRRRRGVNARALRSGAASWQLSGVERRVRIAVHFNGGGASSGRDGRQWRSRAQGRRGAVAGRGVFTTSGGGAARRGGSGRSGRDRGRRCGGWRT